MTYQEKARAMLVRDEGLRLRAYKCTAGRWTIGVGRNLDARGVKGPLLLYYRTVGISKDTAMWWLDEDIATAERDCRHLFGTPRFQGWGETRRLGWVNFLFNVGLKTALEFKNTLSFARAGDWHLVEGHLEKSKWYRQVGPRGSRVVGMIAREEWPGAYG